MLFPELGLWWSIIAGDAYGQGGGRIAIAGCDLLAVDVLPSEIGAPARVIGQCSVKMGAGAHDAYITQISHHRRQCSFLTRNCFSLKAFLQHYDRVMCFFYEVDGKTSEAATVDLAAVPA